MSTEAGNSGMRLRAAPEITDAHGAGRSLQFQAVPPVGCPAKAAGPAARSDTAMPVGREVGNIARGAGRHGAAHAMAVNETILAFIWGGRVTDRRIFCGSCF
jgi:hypothetical protein